ncbi:hypothetical protein GobsT_71610 [Gemmata obscuriglobus]|uniref:DUF1580 domain-containing protein n=1 Tax=Gemmata obscuriglobus TaxID=114 RepID=A0A2Z3HBI1_9BACT|nr:DUF1580 domain-containing protein [Gemmata obscuriglobus]AWM41742.1 DUF1580 domain-containing protein [Gemmata obscuriglobus]QEG32308.1 hypothetical protein GobsT_71610 [Gemmata obscuriglobus]VTS11664.1 : DUF1580 [Gemmata obscuriglobus UQM 2246]
MTPMPRVLTESVLTFAEAAAACPAIGGKRPSPKTIYGWADTGLLMSGDRVKLETARIGGRRVTSKEAIARFFETASAGVEQPAARTPAARNSAADRAMKALRAEFAKV